MKHIHKNISIIVLLLILFASVESSGQVTQKENGDSIEIWVQQIDREYAGINKDTAKFKAERKNIFGQSSEGGLLEKFFDDKIVRKASLTLFGETGQSKDEYYLLNGALIFVNQREENYKKPIYMGKTEVKSREENKFYFKNQKLIRWIGSNGKIMNAALYPEKEKEILDDYKNIN